MVIELESKHIGSQPKPFIAMFSPLSSRSIFFLTVVCASNDYLVRRSLWDDLVEVSLHTSSVPWLVVGDFNVNFHMRETSDYILGMPLFRKELDYMDCIELTGLTNIQSSGAYYTWSNKRVVGF